jgi:zinc protease
MRRAALRIRLITAVLVASAVFAGAAARGAEPASKNFTLDNGLKVCLVEKKGIPLVNAVLSVNVGVKDESADTRGLVHVLEHYILFRGTERRTGSQVGREVREHGAYFNAHTGEDLAWFEISVPAESAEFALANQREIVFDLKITQTELDAEKEVVLEEISQIEDNPFRYATAVAFQNLFRGHAYESPVYGDKNVVRSLEAGKLQEFYGRFFVPANCALAVVGDFGLKDMEDMVRRVFGGVTARPFKKPGYEMAKALSKGVDLEVEMDVQKSYLVIAMPAPDFNHPDQYAVDLLTEIIGRGVNPLLYSALTGRRRLAETLSMSYQALRYGGAILIYLTQDPRDRASAKREAVSFLKTAREVNYSPDDYYGDQQLRAMDYLAGAKNQIRYKAYRAQEKGLSLAASLAGYLLLTDGATEAPSYLESIDKVSSGDVRKAAGKYLSRSDFVIVSVVPKKRSS